jgi:hypothetical protein
MTGTVGAGVAVAAAGAGVSAAGAGVVVAESDLAFELRIMLKNEF